MYKNNPICLATGKKLKYFSSCPFISQCTFLALKGGPDYFCRKVLNMKRACKIVTTRSMIKYMQVSRLTAKTGQAYNTFENKQF